MEAEVHSLLRKVLEDTEFVSFEERGDEAFVAKIRVKSADLDGDTLSAKCDRWKVTFSSVFNCGYICASTVPNATQKWQYQKDFVCHHSSRNKTTKEEKNVRQRNKECNTSDIQMRVKKRTEYTYRSDPLLVKGYDLQITVKKVIFIVNIFTNSTVFFLDSLRAHTPH